MKFFNVLCLFFFIFILKIDSDTVYLKDGKILNGDLYKLNKYSVSIYNKNKIYILNYYDIDYYISDIVNEKKISVSYNNKNNKVILVKLTQDLLFYKENQENNYNTILLNKLSKINFNSYIQNKNSEVIYYSRIKTDKDINKDLDNLMEIIYNNKKNNFNFNTLSIEEIKALSRSIFVDIKNEDYYENIWEKINKLLNKETVDMSWRLLEDYSNKEKYLVLMLNEIKGNNNSSNILNLEIINNRKEFYYRLKKYILGLELAVN